MPYDWQRLTVAEQRELDTLLAAPQTFREFIDRANPAFRWFRAQSLIAGALEAVSRDELRRLMVFMPPQEGKSELIARLFPAYYLHQHSRRWVGLGSYSFALAKGFSRAARAYYRLSVTETSEEAQAVEQWETVNGGGLWAVGRGGSATGRPAHLAIIDDPLKDRQEAESEVTRETLHDWYNSVIRMRLQPENAVVIVHTRWHEDDLAGHLLELEKTTEQPERWHVIDLPGVAEPPADRPRYPATVRVASDWRKPGEPLGGRYQAERYASIRANAGQREYESQIQQRPGASAGTILLRTWWQRHTREETPAGFDRVILSVDCSFKDADDSDYVAMHVYGHVGSKVWGLDRHRDRLSFTHTVDALDGLMARWPRALVYIEDKANGSAVIDTLRQRLLGIIPVEPEGGKIARAYACQGDVQHGRVSLPVGAGWDEMIAECAKFPSGAHDDEVDAFTQAMAVFRYALREPLTEAPNWQRQDPDRHPGFVERETPASPRTRLVLHRRRDRARRPADEPDDAPSLRWGTPSWRSTTTDDDPDTQQELDDDGT